MINKLLQYFNLKLVKLEPKSFLKDIELDADRKNPYDPPEKEIKEEITQEIKPVIKEFKTTSLKIYFKQGHDIYWIDKKSITSTDFSWKDFYTWYFSKNTPFFVFKHEAGETIFLREDIVRIEYLKPVLKRK